MALDILHKKVIAVTTSDVRFSPGETLRESLGPTDLAYGSTLKIYFANEAYTTDEGDVGRVLDVGIVIPPGEDHPILSMRLGDWQIRDNQMHVVEH